MKKHCWKQTDKSSIIRIIWFIRETVIVLDFLASLFRMIKNEYACQVITRSEWPIQLKRWLYNTPFKWLM